MNKQKGFVLITGLFVILILTMLSVIGLAMVNSELKFSSNDRESKKGFYIAEAGTEEARARMQATSPSRIMDNFPTNSAWKLFIGDLNKAQGKGFDAGNSNHVRCAKLYDSDYLVTVTHKLDGSANVLRWGDSNSDGLPEENITTGKPIYVITSEGQTETGRLKTVRIEATCFAEIPKYAALYTKDVTRVKGASTLITGIDQCSSSSSVPGIITRSTVIESGNPTIDGFPTTMVMNAPMDLNIQAMIDSYKGWSNFKYEYPGNQVLTGMHWGIPSPGAGPQSPTSCSDKNAIYFKMNGSSLTLAGGSSGCGILMIEGNLEVNGGFSWYGPILVAGSIKYSGGGEKNMTGMVLSGGVGDLDEVSGNTTIVFCGDAINKLTDDLPLSVQRWEEVNG